MRWKFAVSFPQLHLVWNGFLATGGLAAIVFGTLMTYKSHFEHPQLAYIPTDDTWKSHLDKIVAMAQEQPKVASPSSLLVDVSGAVARPGVYGLSPGARVQDAVLQAGGFVDGAQQSYIHRELRLAEKVFDQQKIYIPFESDSSLAVEKPQTSKNQSDLSSQSQSINYATQKDLEAISGIGAKRAEQILAGIPYGSWEEFLQKNPLSESILAEIQKYYTF